MKQQGEFAVGSTLFVEAALPLAVAAGFIVGSAVLARAGSIDALGYALLVVGAAILLVRGRHPVLALAGTIAAGFAYDVLSYPAGLCTIAIGVALYSAADAGHRRAGLVAIGVVVAAFLGIGLGLGRGRIVDVVSALWFAGWLVASFVLGETTRSRRAYLEEVERRAVAAEQSREDEARRRATEERIRIARELHDILAHRISLITVQSGVGAHLIDRQPEKAKRSLVTINETSREALRELRATLGVLRQADGPEPLDSDTLAPAPGLAQLDGVIADTTAAGVDVQVDVRGEQRALPAGVDLAAYRIIQESLTNVVRHARAARARIVIAYRRTDVTIEIEDDGTARAADDRRTVRLSPGNGLLGMHERAAALGGELEAGFASDGGGAMGGAPGGGFRVRARLPIDGPA